MTNGQTTNGGIVGSHIVSVRKIFYNSEGVSYVVRITEWTGGKADTVELFRVVVGSPPMNKLHAIQINQRGALLVKFPK